MISLIDIRIGQELQLMKIFKMIKEFSFKWSRNSKTMQKVTLHIKL